MKKFWKYLAAAAVILSVTPLMSCDDDDDYSSSPGRPDYSVNRVYMLDPGSAYSTYTYKYSGELIKQLENPLTLTQIRCTRPAPEDVQVVAQIDPSLVDEYNAAKGTNYKFMQGAQLVETDYTIPRGEFLATEKLSVDFTSLSELVGNEDGLILPVAITKVTGGLVISKTSRFFIVFDYKSNVLTPKSTTYLDADVSESGWQSALTNSVVNGFISATWAAEEAVTISATVDKSLIAGYNAAHDADYMEIDATPQTITLAKGETSANLSLRLGNYNAVENGGKYLIPLRLAVTSGEGITLATDVVYIIVRKMPIIMSYVSGSQPSTWTKIQPQDNWSATMTQDGEVSDWTAWIKGEWGDYVDTGDVFEADLGTPTKVAGMGLNFFRWYYSLGSITDIQISNDGNVWENVEGCNFSVGAQDPYLGFNKPQTFRYIRFTCGSIYYPDYGSYLEAVTFWSI